MLIEEIEFYNINGNKTTTVVPKNKKLRRRVLDDRRTLFVGNLPKNCHKQDLRDLLEPGFGKITINMLKKRQLKKSLKRFAFIEFQEDVDLKMVKEKMNGKIFMNEKIVIENILTKEEKKKEMVQKTKNATPDLKPLSTDTLYVKNIPMKCSNEELANIFGVVPKNVNFVRRQLVDLRTNKVFFSDEFHTGEAFIKFDNLRVGDNIQKKCREFKGCKARNGRVLLVKVASVKKNLQNRQVEDKAKIKQN